jgi:hypothetical protein
MKCFYTTLKSCMVRSECAQNYMDGSLRRNKLRPFVKLSLTTSFREMGEEEKLRDNLLYF